MRQAQHGALLDPEVACLVQIVDEHEVGHLLHHVQRVGDAAGPENLPEGVDPVFQLTCNHVPFSLPPYRTEQYYSIYRKRKQSFGLAKARECPRQEQNDHESRCCAAIFLSTIPGVNK